MVDDVFVVGGSCVCCGIDGFFSAFCSLPLCRSLYFLLFFFFFFLLESLPAGCWVLVTFGVMGGWDEWTLGDATLCAFFTPRPLAWVFFFFDACKRNRKTFGKTLSSAFQSLLNSNNHKRKKNMTSLKMILVQYVYKLNTYLAHDKYNVPVLIVWYTWAYERVCMHEERLVWDVWCSSMNKSLKLRAWALIRRSVMSEIKRS